MYVVYAKSCVFSRFCGVCVCVCVCVIKKHLSTCLPVNCLLKKVHTACLSTLIRQRCLLDLLSHTEAIPQVSTYTIISPGFPDTLSKYYGKEIDYNREF